MCDCSCTSCFGSSHCGSCIGNPRPKEIRGGKCIKCDCKFRNGIQDNCLGITCKRNQIDSNDRIEKRIESATIKQNREILNTGNLNEQQQFDNTINVTNQLKQQQQQKEHQQQQQQQELQQKTYYTNNGLDNALQYYTQTTQPILDRIQSGNSFNAYHQVQEQTLYNQKMLSENNQMNNSVNNYQQHPQNDISNYLTPTNQLSSYQMAQQYNQSNQPNSNNTMLNQKQFKESDIYDSMQMCYEGKPHELNNHVNFNDNEINNSNNSNKNMKNSLENSNGIVKSIIINPRVDKPISIPLFDNGTQKIQLSQHNQSGIITLNSIPLYPCMTVVFNLQDKTKHPRSNKTIKKKY